MQTKNAIYAMCSRSSLGDRLCILILILLTYSAEVNRLRRSANLGSPFNKHFEANF